MFFVILQLLFLAEVSVSVLNVYLSLDLSVLLPTCPEVSARGRGDLNVLWTIISSIGCKLKWAARQPPPPRAAPALHRGLPAELLSSVWMDGTLMQRASCWCASVCPHRPCVLTCI